MLVDNALYEPVFPVRIVTASSLFDGHDATINIMRRIIQSAGVEVIHLGHNRSVDDIVEAAIHEDVQAVAITSYQGGHMEFFKYMKDQFNEAGANHIRIFGGGGGVILPEEIYDLEKYGITKIFSPDDGRVMGLNGMISYLLKESDFERGKVIHPVNTIKSSFKYLAESISAVENSKDLIKPVIDAIKENAADITPPVLGITGTGGAGKSSLVDELVRRFKLSRPDLRLCILSVDPTKRKTGGALLGDRIRMNSIHQAGVFMRSLATRQSHISIPVYMNQVLQLVGVSNFDLIILETSGIGQSDTEIADFSDMSLYVMTPEYGAATQLEKIDMLDYANIVALNKFDKRGADDALRDVKKQFQRNRALFDEDPEDMPVVGTVASQFNDPGVNELYLALVKTLRDQSGLDLFPKRSLPSSHEKIEIIPPRRIRYLAEIAETVRKYNEWTQEQAGMAEELYALDLNRELLKDSAQYDSAYRKLVERLSRENFEIIQNWEQKKADYNQAIYKYKVRNKIVEVETKTETLSHLMIPKVSLPKFTGWGNILKWVLRENVPGEFPYAAGVFPYKLESEDPTRMFAGEGGPERTNKRFHYLSRGLSAKRLSTAYDSVTLYGEDPNVRPDIYGKVGNSGVSVCSLDDSKRLYSGFDLESSKTSVSMTINGPASILAAFFLNTAVDQACEKYIIREGLEEQTKKFIQNKYKALGKQVPVYRSEIPDGHDGSGLLLLGVTGDEVLPADIYKQIKQDTINKVRGTLQADILKEDQAQNTCLFSIDFSMKLMADVQEYFIQNGIRNFYSVSISGYHIAEAGANPITQLAFTLANGFTYLEYFLARGMNIDDFAPNLSFFFSNGLDIEFSVIGRVARIIWAKAIKNRYKGNERSQKLKYHIQTSGRSLHAQEIDFNDIRTSLQALYAVYDNCNSWHTNAYDEAITTPTEESVRRALAIQLIINHELGLSKNQNPLQGSFIVEELTDLVEEAVLSEFERISDRGGVLGAMELNYQRNKIQEESLYYERLKNSGELPIMGVNTFLSAKGSPIERPGEVIRAGEDEKQMQLDSLEVNIQVSHSKTDIWLDKIQQAAINQENIFAVLMEASKYASLGQITHALFDVGGRYRRNM
ncbi:MAG: methylmalonyl-CoA mutase family protein [Bacteroidetes bacterium]|nr:methylmalonyl-CoA mutase family protein [Bacteroidota bacterium]